MFNVKSVKKGITIIMVSNEVYDLWSKMLLFWEEQLLLDKLPLKPPKGVEKSTLACLVGLIVPQLIELGNKLLKRKVTF